MEGFYINLNSRTDRKNHIEKLKVEYPFFQNIKRMEAIYSDKYGLGCALSHLKCLEELEKIDKPYYLIMEDDFFILNKENFDNFINDFEKIKNNNNWDVITLTPKGNTTKKFFLGNFNKIIRTQTATCYILKSSFLKTLIEIIKQGVEGLKKGSRKIKKHNENCVDQCWKPIQEKTNWIYYYKIFAGQLPGYSDIQKKYVNYNKRFLSQKNK